jgi:hypothetical protein
MKKFKWPTFWIKLKYTKGRDWFKTGNGFNHGFNIEPTRYGHHNLKMIVRKLRRKEFRKKNKWKFHHYFQEESFQEHLKNQFSSDIKINPDLILQDMRESA